MKYLKTETLHKFTIKYKGSDLKVRLNTDVEDIWERWEYFDDSSSWHYFDPFDDEDVPIMKYLETNWEKTIREDKLKRILGK